MKIAFLTFGVGHLVSDLEFARLVKALTKVNVELYRGIPETYDLLMVKGWSHTWAQVEELNVLKRPVVYLSIGAEWKLNASPEMNEPIRELYEKADKVIHIAKACKESHWQVFPKSKRFNDEVVIIPACEPNLMAKLPDVGPHRPLKLATTCIPRPVKRLEQLQALCKKYDIELIAATGATSDFSYYHDCDGYIHLSRKEGMPNTVLEAMSYGLPCIVTNYGGAKEAVGDAGVVIMNDSQDAPWDIDHIEPIDELLFKKAIEEFTERYPEFWYKTRERVLTKLNDYVMACQFQKVFQSLCV